MYTGRLRCGTQAAFPDGRHRRRRVPDRHFRGRRNDTDPVEVVQRRQRCDIVVDYVKCILHDLANRAVGLNAIRDDGGTDGNPDLQRE